ncbi:uncharacterized protein LOC134841473, partial [Symsagittifera roscoffensis]|uniref:uncharacterized protein LOC134841473 n=1 Tax=Symsagittifera roscoffensis TaxID=84072 RepID=UPI00307C4AA6
MECEQGAAVEMDVGEEFVARCKQQLQQRATPEEQWEGEGEAPVVVAIGVLVDFLSSIRHSVTTVAEVLRLLKAAIQDMVTRSNRNRSSHTNVALESGCEIFNWYITRFTAEPSFERSSLEEIMDEILKYGRQYLQALKASRSKIAAYGKGLIRDNST